MKRILFTLTLFLSVAFASVNAQDNYDATTMGKIVRYYETAKWAQGSPFNNQCWTDATQSNHAKTGCVPTAFAIVMRHHGFPAEGIGNLLNQQTGAKFEDRTYDWTKMPLSSGSGWTAEQQNEVAKLMSHLGHAFGVSFGSGETSVSIGNTMSERMRDYFNYNYVAVSNQYDNGKMYDFATWKNNLKNSLNNGCPVPYAANNKKDGTGDSRHMFVIDGYTENEYFHFNFGWGGGSNGWFKLDDITPPGDNYSWLDSGNGYDSKHQAYFNLSPNATKYAVTATATPATMGTVSINGGTAGITANAELMQGYTATLKAHPANGYALASWTKNGVIVGTKNTLEVKVGTENNEYVANFDEASNVLVIKDYIISPSTVGLTDGKVAVVNYQTSDEYPAALSLASTSTSGTSLNAMSKINDSQIRLYAYDQATSNTTIKYTLSVPEDYIITEYSFEYSINSTSYPCKITYSGGTISSPTDTGWYPLSATVNAQTAEFTMIAEKGHASSSFYIKNFTVSVAKEGASIPETPVTPPAPVTYTITATANPATGGSVSPASSTVNAGESVTLTATPNTNYAFAGWYNGTNKVSDNTTYTVSNVNANATYVAQFNESVVEPEQPGGTETPTTNLAGKYFRIKVKNTTNYMNVANTDNNNASTSGITLVAKSLNSNTQIFLFEQSGNGYKLKAQSGAYIKCHAWNANANATTANEATELTFEPAGGELEYLIKWDNKNMNNGVERDDYFKYQNVSGTLYVYCDAASSAASTWVLEEAVIPTISFNAEVEGWTSANPNTHFGGITLTCGGTEKKITLTTANLETNRINVDVSGNNVSLAFTRKYRGLDFVGFSIDGTDLGKNPTLTTEQKNKLVDGTPLVVKFKTDGTDDVTLFYDDDQYSYRIPAIAKTGTNRLVAVSDYRHNLDDIGRDNHGTGKKRIDLVMRTSDDNGKTWSEIKTIAAGDDSKVGDFLRAFGDAAIAAYGNNILIMSAAGDVLYTNGTTSNPNKMARIYSTDNGATWTIEEMTTKMYSQSTSLVPSGGSAFFGSGKLAVDENFNGTGKARIYGALLVRIGNDGYNNFGVFSDDLGATWKILGGDNVNPVAKGDEPKIEILPNGQILLSARRVGGRVFRVFTYGNDKANGAGSWGDAATNGCDNGGQNGTNGEIFCIDAKKPNGTATKILLQSQPQGGTGQYDRNNVTIWYKEVSANKTYTADTIASGWTKGKQVSTVKSAYSAMCLQANGEIALFFEEAPCYGDDHTKGYSMVYVPLTIEEITEYNFYSPNVEFPDITAVKVVLTDANGNEFYESVEGATTAEAVASALKNKYPYITLGENGKIAIDNGTYVYTNSVTLPFKVSNDKQYIWHNIYWPANTNENGYPVYLSASSANDTNVPKVTESFAYGSSSYNTLNNSNKINWAIYSVDNGFTFILKNELTGKYIQATGVASGNAQNVIYVDEANATAFEIVPDAASYRGDYALKATINGTVGYLCSTSATGYHFATHYNGNSHAGAWVKFEEPDYEAIIAQINDALASVNNGIYTLAAGKVTTYNTIKEAMNNSGDVKLNTLKDYLTNVATLFEGATLNVPTKGKYYRFKAYNNSNAYMVSNGISTRMTVNINPDNAASIFYINDNNQPVNYKYGIGVKDTYDSGSVTSTKETFTFTTNNNGFVITTNTRTVNNNNNGEYVYHHAIGENAQTANVNRNSQAAGDRTTWLVEAVASLPVTISSAGYATLYAPVALKVPTSVTAYTVEINGEWATLNEIEGGVIPANTGVVLHGNPDTYYFVITTTDNTAESALNGTVAAEFITENAYVLTLGDDGEACFGIATKNQQGDTAFLNNSHKAYLPKPVGSNVASYSFRFPDTTAVEEVETENTEVVIYDLAGRRINEITEGGIYIIGGRKVLVK